MEKKLALVVGASGISGRGLVEHLGGLDDWDVIALARRGTKTRARAWPASSPSTCSTPMTAGRSSARSRA
jgi:uncharacterized protein YbjT (DUF2867 family)